MTNDYFIWVAVDTVRYAKLAEEASDYDRYCIACGYARCRCGKNYHPTVNEAHAMYQRHAKLVEAAKAVIEAWNSPREGPLPRSMEALEVEVGDE